MFARTLLCLAFLLALLQVSCAQIAHVNASNTLAAKLVELFNKNDAQTVVAMATPEFKKGAAALQIAALVQRVHSLGTVGAPELILDIGEQRHYKVLVKHDGQPDRALLLVVGAESATKYFSIGLAPYKGPELRAKPFATDNPHKSVLDNEVQGAVDRFMGQNSPIGISIGVLSLGHESYFNYGEIANGSGVLPTSKTIYEIGSITKTMTGILLAHAIIDRKVSLDDDIRKDLPGSFPNLEYEGKPILLRHLATHTSGLPGNPPGIPDDGKADAYERYTHAMLLSDLAGIQLKRAPGLAFSYSNMGAGLCGPILEQAYGLPYEKLLQKYVFGPARIRDSGITLTPSMDRNYATGHDSTGAKTDRWTVNGIEAAGAVRSDAVDMIRYARLNLNEKDPAVALSHRLLSDDSSVPMGIFWERKDSRTGGLCLTHEGGTGGFSTNIIVMPEKNFAVVVMMNSLDQQAGQLGYEIALRILNARK